MAAPSLASLLLQQTQAVIYNGILSIATTLGLPTTSWQPGDPTRSLFFAESSLLEQLETIVVSYIQSGFLDYASGMWLQILAQQVYGVQVPAATFAETDVVLTNTGGGFFDLGPGDVTVSNSTTGVTYHSTTGGTLDGSGATLTITVVADVAGSAGSSGSGEIDTMITGLDGVTVTNPDAAVGIDTWSDETVRQQCRNFLGSLSPNGPAAAYSFVALNSTLTGISTISRVRVYDDSDTGDVTVYVAGPSGAVSSPDVAAVQAAVEQWATPLCITPTVISANAVTVNVTYSIWLYQSVNQTSSQIQAAILSALGQALALRPIGGDVIPPSGGMLYQSFLQDTIADVFPEQTFRVVVSLPSGDTSLGLGDVAELGVVTPTVTLIPDPR